jgi:hypothetical protein
VHSDTSALRGESPAESRANSGTRAGDENRLVGQIADAKHDLVTRRMRSSDLGAGAAFFAVSQLSYIAFIL